MSGWGTLSSGGSQASSLQEVTVTTMTNTQVRSQRSCVILPASIIEIEKHYCNIYNTFQCTSSPMKYPSSYITEDMICAGGGWEGRLSSYKGTQQ